MYAVQTTNEFADYNARAIAASIMRGIDKSNRRIIITDSETGSIVFHYENKGIQLADIDFVIQALSEN